MKFSIIIPVHNNESTIERCVNSIINQNADIQIILVENKSSDNSFEVCEQICRNNKNIELYRSNIANVSLARNIGLKKAEGEIIGFCDADDYYDKNILKKVESLFSINKNIDIIYAGFTYVDGVQEIKFNNKKEEIINTHTAIEYVMCNSPIMGSVWNKFYKKEIIDDALFDESLEYLEDGYFNVELLSKNRHAEIYVTKENSYYYVVNNNGTSKSLLNVYDSEGKSKYNKAMYKMINNLDINEDEKNFVRDNICKLSINCVNKETQKNKKIYFNLTKSIKDNYLTFVKRLLKFDIKHRIRVCLKGLIIIIKSARKHV